MRGNKIRALLVLWFALFLSYGKPTFASSLELNISVGIDGQYKESRYIPISVGVKNEG